MAHGDRIVGSQAFRRYKLIDAEASTNNGVWIETADLATATLHVVMSSTGTIKVCGSDEATKPADSTHGYQIGPDITSTQGVTIDILPAYLKVRVTANAGTITVTGTLRPTVRAC